MNSIIKTYAFRLNPTKEQEQQLAQCAGAVRFVYNWGLAQYKQFFEMKEKASHINTDSHTFEQNSHIAEIQSHTIDASNNISHSIPDQLTMPTAYGLAYELPKLKKAAETAWLSQAPAQALQQGLADLQLSMKAFFRERKRNPLYGFPRFKAKGKRDSFRIPQAFKWKLHQVHVPKVGWVAYYDRSARRVEGTIKLATIKYNGVHWFVNIVCEIPAKDKSHDLLNNSHSIAESNHEQISVTQEVIGKNRFVVIDKDGVQEYVHVPAFMDNLLTKYKRLSRKVSRCTKDSKRWHKAVKQLTKLHITITNRRKDYLHKLTTDMITKYPDIVVKSFDIKGKIKGNRWHANRQLHDLAWGHFENYLTYKAQWYNKNVVIEK